MLRRLLLLFVLVAGACSAAPAHAATLRGISEVSGGSRWEQWIQNIQSSAAVEGCSPVAPTVHLRFTRTPAPGFRIRWSILLSSPSRPLLFGRISGSVAATEVAADGTLPLWRLLSNPGYPGSSSQLYPLTLPMEGRWTFAVAVWGSDEPLGSITAWARPRSFSYLGSRVAFDACRTAGYPTYFVS